MSAHENISQKDVQPLGTRATLAEQDGRRGSQDDARLPREDKRELQKIRCELLTLADRLNALILRTASQE